MISSRHFHGADDMEALKPYRREIDEIMMAHVDWNHIAVAPGEAYTILDDELPIAVIGITMVREWMGEQWMISTKGISYAGNGAGILRVVRRRWISAVKALELKRIGTPVEAADEAGIRITEFLGLSYEGQLPGYGPNGELFYQYGRSLWE